MLRRLRRCSLYLSITSCPSNPTYRRLYSREVPKTLTLLNSDTTVSYLVESCGLSPQAAVSIAKTFTLKSAGNADSFISFLRSYGFTQSQISNIVTNHPRLINSNLENTIKPKMEYLLNMGYSKSGLVNLILSDPCILKSSLKNRIERNFELLKSTLGSDEKAATAIKNYSRVLRYNLDDCILKNMKTLQDIGVPVDRVIKLTTNYPRSMMKSPDHFNQAISYLNKLGFDVSKVEFCLGVNVLSGLSSSTWNKKFELYQSLGFSVEDFFIAFKVHPYCMLISEEKLKQNLGFLTEKFNWHTSYVAARSSILCYSFDNRIYPRYKTFQLLTSQSGIKKIKCGFVSFVRVAKKKFLNDYVIKYADQIPEVREIYKRELELTQHTLQY